MNLFGPSEQKGALFSDDGGHRYVLWRIWDTTRPCIQFVGLNPSTANEDQDDPTIRRLMGFTKKWGYGGFYMTNLFALVSPHPEDLRTAEDPIGDNDRHLVETRKKCEHIVFCWGAFPKIFRDIQVARMFEGALCFGTTKDGSPKHPLYLPASTTLVPFIHPLK